jgi:hypothetical protein
MNPMRSVLLILCMACASISAWSAPRPPVETVSGRVVAFSGATVCLNGNAYWSIVIHVSHPKSTHSELIRVDFSLPCDKSPEWLSAEAPIQKFHLLRQKDCDAPLEGSMDGKPKPNLAIPTWKNPPGAEHVTLPFGQVIPCYRSVDLPLAPVV